MTSFLEKIYSATEERLAAAKRERPAAGLEAAPFFSRQPRDIRKPFAKDDYNIIAEVKFASPSEGRIRDGADPLRVAEGYLAAGARMLSILTEPLYFKGELDYLTRVREACPDALLLRKDFMIDTYQLLEARACGADVILLIVALTDKALTKDLFDATKELGLTPLVEVHDAGEFEAALALGAQVIGVNNRNLKTLKTDLDTSRSLAARKPPGALFICESGLSTPQDLQAMRRIGYDGFLMGSHFMKAPDPGLALKTLREQLACT